MDLALLPSEKSFFHAKCNVALQQIESSLVLDITTSNSGLVNLLLVDQEDQSAEALEISAAKDPKLCNIEILCNSKLVSYESVLPDTFPVAKNEALPISLYDAPLKQLLSKFDDTMTYDIVKAFFQDGKLRIECNSNKLYETKGAPLSGNSILYPQQRLIAERLFERMLAIIGKDEFDKFTDLSFAVIVRLKRIVNRTL